MGNKDIKGNSCDGVIFVDEAAHIPPQGTLDKLKEALSKIEAQVYSTEESEDLHEWLINYFDGRHNA